MQQKQLTLFLKKAIVAASLSLVSAFFCLETTNATANTKTVTITATVPPEPSALTAAEAFTDLPSSIEFTYDRASGEFGEQTRTVTTPDSYTVTIQQNTGLTHESETSQTLTPYLSINDTTINTGTAQHISGAGTSSIFKFGIQKTWDGGSHPMIGIYHGNIVILFEDES